MPSEPQVGELIAFPFRSHALSPRDVSDEPPHRGNCAVETELQPEIERRARAFWMFTFEARRAYREGRIQAGNHFLRSLRFHLAVGYADNSQATHTRRLARAETELEACRDAALAALSASMQAPEALS